MAKKKNHTNHNQNKKNHRNGIKMVKFCKKADLRGVNKKVLMNNIYAGLYQKTGRTAEVESN